MIVNTADAAKLARAIKATEDRYREGKMSKATYKKHLASLWGTVDHRHLREAVLTELTNVIVDTYNEGSADTE